MGRSNTIEVKVESPIGFGQVNVYVKDRKGRPLKGAIVKIYRTIPYSFVVEGLTDENGFISFNGLWPWSYIIAGEYEDMSTQPIHFTIIPGKTYEFELIARPPPHLYEMRIQCGIEPIAQIGKWLIENISIIRNTIIGFPNHEFINAWVEDSFLVIRFKVVKSPFPWAAIGAILAILVVLAIIGWEIKEIIPTIPEELWYLLGLAGAGVGLGFLVYSIKKR